MNTQINMNTQSKTGSGNRSKLINVLLWVLQGLLALVFVAHGWLMVSPPAELVETINKSIGHNLSLFIGVAELLAAIGLILPGITRQLLLQNSRKFGLFPIEKIVRADDLLGAEAVFLCNSLRFIRPVTKLDGKALGARPLDELREGLSLLAKQHCGIDPRDIR